MSCNERIDTAGIWTESSVLNISSPASPDSSAHKSLLSGCKFEGTLLHTQHSVLKNKIFQR
jgi:hypothetical protein